METYKIQTGDTLGGLAKRYGTTTQDLMKSNPTITDPNKIFAGSSLNVPKVAPSTSTVSTTPPPITSITSPVTTPTPVNTPTLPVPKAQTTYDTYFTSGVEQVANTRKAVEDSYKKNIKNLEDDKKDAQREVDKFTEMQQTILDQDVEPLVKPFREKLEKTERDRLYINENFEANQALTRELESLLTEGNELIQRQKEQPVVLSVLNKKVQKTMADVSARSGVIEAVMAARTGQIGEAYRLIDRSIDAVNADRKDQLDFYSTILDFYEGQKTDAKSKVEGLDKDQKDFIKAQVGLLENDLANAEKNANHIKDLMVDPETALFMANAGVTLNDTPEEVTRKMAEQSRRDEVKDLKNELALEGYTYLPFPPEGEEGIQYFNVGGQKLAFRAPPGGAGGSNQMTDNERALMTQFRGEQIVKDFNEVLAQKGTIDAYIQNGVGGPADLALVFSFMKGLDPTSVVRESEYETAAKSGNIFAGVFAKFNGYFKEKGGFLPPSVREEFQNLVNQKLGVKKAQYDNLKIQYRGIAERQGLNPDNVAINYEAGGVEGDEEVNPDDPMGIFEDGTFNSDLFNGQ